MPAGREELVPLVDGGELWPVHDRKLLGEAQPARVGGGVKGGQVGEDPPGDGVGSPLVLEAPYVAHQAGVDPLLRVAEAGLVIAISGFPRGSSYAGVGGIWLA